MLKKLFRSIFLLDGLAEKILINNAEKKLNVKHLSKCISKDFFPIHGCFIKSKAKIEENKVQNDETSKFRAFVNLKIGVSNEETYNAIFLVDWSNSYFLTFIFVL